MDIKQKLRNKQLTIGSWITIPDPAIAEIMAKAGFEWLTIDMEHSAITMDQCQQLIRVIDLCGVVPIVRAGANDALLIKRAMDAGAYGVIVPMVNTKEDAIKAVASVKYPPLGKRGVGLARAQGYGLDFERYKKWVNKNSIVVVQIEHIEAISNLEDILQVNGVDASIIGPYDLSASMGHAGEYDRKDVKSVLKEYIKVCNKLNKPAGFHVITPDAGKAKDKIRNGFRFIAFGLDTLFLGIKIKEELRFLRKRK